MNTRTLLAWGVFGIGLLSWIGVYVMWSYINSALVANQKVIDTQKQNASAAATAMMNHTLFIQSKDDRTALYTLVTKDPGSVIDVITQAENQGGIKVTVTNSNPVRANTPGIRAVSLIVGSSGSYADVMRALAILERLPLISTIDTIDLSTSKQTKTTQWYLNAHVTVTTLSPTP